jgi:2-polyprenyl-3-methyl-5-hydroxy-6-metoxy-1,4-benzoquinol methylase
MDASKKDQMITFWSERARLYEGDPRANTNDIWLREIEIDYVHQVLQSHPCKNVLDFGCANGYSTTRLARSNPQCRFTGIDINPDMISVAQTFPQQDSTLNLAFMKLDVLEDALTEKYDLIYAIRVFQNIESLAMQKRVLDKLLDLLQPGGLLLYIESYLDGYTRLNTDRVKMGLTPLPIHPHLTLLTEEFDNHVSRKMALIKRDSLSSSYYLITRLLYSYIAQTNNEPIDYNHAIHQVAAMVPQIGDYGPQYASLFQTVQG